MTRIVLPLVLIVAALTTAAFSPPDVSRPQGQDETQLSKYMDEINKTLRKLRSTLRDPSQNAESLGMVRDVQLLVVKAKSETPARTAELPEEERAAYVADYGREMCEFLRKLVDLEVAVLDGDSAAAQELRNEINKMKSPAHDKFRVKDDEEAPADK